MLRLPCIEKKYSGEYSNTPLKPHYKENIMRRKGNQRTGTERNSMDELINRIGGAGGYGGKRITPTTKMSKAEKKKRDRPIEKDVSNWNPSKPKRAVSERISGRADILKLRAKANKKLAADAKAASKPKPKKTKTKKKSTAKVSRRTKVLGGTAAGLSAAAASQWIIHKD